MKIIDGENHVAPVTLDCRLGLRCGARLTFRGVEPYRRLRCSSRSEVGDLLLLPIFEDGEVFALEVGTGFPSFVVTTTSIWASSVSMRATVSGERGVWAGRWRCCELAGPG